VILSAWITKCADLLTQSDIENAHHEPYQWLSYISGQNRAYFVARAGEPFDEVVSEEQRVTLEDICRRRQNREPLAYILGSAGFWGREFKVGPGVLIPRPDSEIAIEVIRNAYGMTASTTDAFRFMDLCTGSGCLGISLAHAFQDNGMHVKGILTEISEDASIYAKQNIASHALQQELIVLICDLFPSRSDMKKYWGDVPADLVIANPPYITDHEISVLMPEVKDFEPLLALKGGADGLDFYRRILSEGKSFLASGGMIVMEHGYDQEETVSTLCEENGYVQIQCFRDYGGQPRVTAAKMP
jgi:release factor glutamine methyltransferase